jgi:tetratricopeptide (TPR) repeat protein
MNVVDQIMRWLGLEIHSSPQPADQAIRQWIEAAQHAKRSEDYDRALSLFDKAAHQAETARDLHAAAVIDLYRAEIYIQRQDWPAAEHLLLKLRHTAQTHGLHTHLSYALSALGTLAQAQGDWPEARAYYEQALKVGQTAHSLGGEARALGHLADTYLHENNASYAVHLLRDALPRLNMSGELEWSSYFVGRLGEALIATGQDDEGERLLYRALRLAEQTSQRRFERRWALALGERLLATMRCEAAQQHLERALALLPAAAPAPHKARALAHLSRAYYYLTQPEPALETAQAAVEQAALLDDPPLQALAEGALGMAQRLNNNNLRAIRHLQAAVERYGQVNGAGSSRFHVEILRNLAAAQADMADHDAAEATYQQALAQAQKLDTPLDVAQTRVELALLYRQRRAMQAAVEHWQAALATYTDAHHYPQMARLYCDLAGARRYLGQGQRAIKDYEQALITLNSVDDWATRGVVVANAAIIYADLGEIESADAFFNEAITIARRLHDPAAEAIRRGNYGWFLLVTGRAHQAAAALEYALGMSREQGSSLQTAVQTSNLALLCDQQGETARALDYHAQARALLPRLHDAHWHNMIEIHYARTLIGQRRPDEAAPLLAQALRQGRAGGDAEVIIGALTGQARVALLQGQPAQAGPYLSEAVALARRADMRRLLAAALHAHSEQQAALGQPDMARSLWDEAQRLYTVLHAPEARQQPGWLLNPAGPG